VAALIGLVLRDAYRRNEVQPARRAAFDILTATAFIIACEAILALLVAAGGWSPDWILPLRRGLMTAPALPMVFCLRLAADYRLSHPAGQMSMADLAGEYQNFARGVRWRNRAIAIGGILGAGVSIVLFWRAAAIAPSAAPLVGWAISTPLGLFIVWYIAARTSVKPLTADMAFAALLALYRSELERQSNLLRRVWWWYLLSIAPVVAGAMFGKGLAPAEPALGPIRPQQIAAYVVICFFVGWLYLQYAHRISDRLGSLAGASERSP